MNTNKYIESAKRIIKTTTAIAALGLATAAYLTHPQIENKAEYVPMTQSVSAESTVSGKEYQMTSLKHPILGSETLVFRSNGGVEAIVTKTLQNQLAVNVSSEASPETVYSIMDMNVKTFDAYVNNTRQTGKADIELLKHQREGNLGYQNCFQGTKRDNNYIVKE